MSSSAVSQLESLLALRSDPLGLEPIPEDTRQRFLRFNLSGTNKTLLPLEVVAEVLQLDPVEILPVPEVSAYLLGVYNWRGEILWLVDLNVLVGDAPLWHQTPFLEQPMLLIVESGERRVGLVVEQVDDVELVAPEEIHPPTELYSTALAHFVLGYLPNHGGTVLDVDVIVERSLQAPP